MQQGEVPLPGPDLRERTDYEEIPFETYLALSEPWPIHTFIKHPGQRIEIHTVSESDGPPYVVSVTRGEGRFKDMQTAYYQLTLQPTIEASLRIWTDAGFEQRDELGEPPAPDENPFQDVLNMVEEMGQEDAARARRDFLDRHSSSDAEVSAQHNENGSSWDGAIDPADIETEIEETWDDGTPRLFRVIHRYRVGGFDDPDVAAIIDYSQRRGWATLRRDTEYYDGCETVREDREVGDVEQPRAGGISREIDRGVHQR